MDRGRIVAMPMKHMQHMHMARRTQTIENSDPPASPMMVFVAGAGAGRSGATDGWGDCIAGFLVWDAIGEFKFMVL